MGTKPGSVRLLSIGDTSMSLAKSVVEDPCPGDRAQRDPARVGCRLLAPVDHHAPYGRVTRHPRRPAYTHAPGYCDNPREVPERGSTPRDAVVCLVVQVY